MNRLWLILFLFSQPFSQTTVAVLEFETEGLDNISSSVSGGSYIIGDGDGGGPGGASSNSSHYGKKGGKPYEPQTMVGGQNSLSDIAKALGVSYQEGYYWWGSHYVWGNGGSGSRYGVGMDGYARNGYYGGYGYIMVIMDSNPD